MSKANIRVEERESSLLSNSLFFNLSSFLSKAYSRTVSPVQFTFLLNNERSQLLLLSLSLLCIRLQQISSSNCLPQTFSKLQVPFQSPTFIFSVSTSLETASKITMKLSAIFWKSPMSPKKSWQTSRNS